jgi:hypothetical protein
MKTEREAIHFLKWAEIKTGKKCFVRGIKNLAGKTKWKIFTSEEDYESYLTSGKHSR